MIAAMVYRIFTFRKDSAVDEHNAEKTLRISAIDVRSADSVAIRKCSPSQAVVKL